MPKDDLDRLLQYWDMIGLEDSVIFSDLIVAAVEFAIENNQTVKHLHEAIDVIFNLLKED